jgi:hypothetical protein
MFTKKAFPSMILPIVKQRLSNQLILLFGLAVCVPAFGGTNALETALLKARNAAPSTELLGSVFVSRTNAPSPVVLEQSLKACAAGLIYLNNADGYRSKVRPLIADADSFEESIKVPCGACKGEKSVTIPCSNCKGSGRCAAFRCKGGSITSPGFDGSQTVSNCSKCKGSGVCSMCRGGGRVPFLCQSCKGGGKMFSPDVALTVYREAVEQALSGMTSGSLERTDLTHDREKPNQADDVLSSGLVGGSQLIREYPLVPGYDAALDSETHTEVQIDNETEKLWNRSRSTRNPMLRLLFIPLPDRLKYEVRNVRKEENAYFVELHHKEDGGKIRTPYGESFVYAWSDVTICVPISKRRVENLAKGQLVVSKNFIQPMEIRRTRGNSNNYSYGRPDRSSLIFRCDADFYEFVGEH